MTTRAAWSLDGSRIAFARELRGPGLYAKVYAARPDGSDLQEVPNSGQHTYVTHLSWSLDGSEIWFVGRQYHSPDRGSRGFQALHAIKVDGSGTRTIANLEVGISPIAWSPDRRRIAVHDISRNPSYLDVVLYTLAADGSDRRVLVRVDEDGRLVTENTAAGGP